jgi:hypothetical protein
MTNLNILEPKVEQTFLQILLNRDFNEDAVLCYLYCSVVLKDTEEVPNIEQAMDFYLAHVKSFEVTPENEDNLRLLF